MPSPFPGMDPYLEAQCRSPGFHDVLIAHCSELLNREPPESYVAQTDERIALISFDNSASDRIPDVLIGREEGSTASEPSDAPAAVGTIEPTTMQLLKRGGSPRDLDRDLPHRDSCLVPRPGRSSDAAPDVLDHDRHRGRPGGHLGLAPGAQSIPGRVLRDGPRDPSSALRAPSPRRGEGDGHSLRRGGRPSMESRCWLTPSIDLVHPSRPRTCRRYSASSGYPPCSAQPSAVWPTLASRIVGSAPCRSN
jgi:Protein of unknown function (DUF4058)